MDDPFSELESENDPIMVAARLRRARQAKGTENDEFALQNEQNEAETAAPSSRHESPTPPRGGGAGPVAAAATDQWRHAAGSPPPTPPSCSRRLSSQPRLGIMVLGKTGDGKSRLLNDILGGNVFTQKASLKSQTETIEERDGFWAPLRPYMEHKDTFGCFVRVFDTPGFADSEHRDEKFIPMIQDKILHLARHPPALHCLLVVFKITTTQEQIFHTLDILASLWPKALPSEAEEEAKEEDDVRVPQGGGFWQNVILVFTHADLGKEYRYRDNKLTLKTTVARNIASRYGLAANLPMAFISTLSHTCRLLKGDGNCDCQRGNRYHADARRRLYEQVWQRHAAPLRLTTPSNPSAIR
ncbi:hypothetical protein BC940DRAFT_362930 [Gongronella butleri]|nr:hypothetical protein BC940DRAFT_362930 [Gongronella butleri]